MTPPHVGFAAIPAPDFTRAAQNNLNIGRSNDVGRIRDYTLGDRTNQDMYGCDGEDRYDNASGHLLYFDPELKKDVVLGFNNATFWELSSGTQVCFYKQTTRDGFRKVEVRETRES